MSGLTYPNRIALAFFMAMGDVMGQHGLSTLLDLVELSAYDTQLPSDTLDRQFDFSEIAALNVGLEAIYGTRGGRGMALRIGRAAFAQGLRRFGAMRAVSDPVFRQLPTEKQLQYGASGLAHIMTNFSSQVSHLEDDGSTLSFISDVSPFAWNRHAERPVCHMMVGILQECLRWSTNGHEFYVREVSCRATGSEQCVFQINKTIIG